jgi:UDP-N-acetylmuramoyl-L-alanyl-D-glutamate--2,6-diaminopimelate ligase
MYLFKKLLKAFIPTPLISFYHLTLAYFAALFYRFPSKEIITIGITGTKGKTTVTELLTKILETTGEKVALINGLRFKIDKIQSPNLLKMTMPGRGKLQKFLRDAVNSGCKYAIIETTSEGIKQHRHRFIKFHIAAITNLQKEHIESHGSFEAYRAAKGKLFEVTSNIHVLNKDDPNFEYFNNFKAKFKYYYSLESKYVPKDKVEFIAPEKYKIAPNGTYIFISGTEIKANLIGEFNLYNILCAIAISRALGISWKNIKTGIESFNGVEGRLEILQREPFMVIVDYAHTPDSLEAVYQTVKKAFSPKKIICVLGSAGGGRDKWKRPEMGNISAKYCDEVILTNEDPYDEDPKIIIDQIEEGLKREQRFVENKVTLYKIIDRKEAIKFAISKAEVRSAVIITGKGGEKWMVLAGGRKIPWSDSEIAKEALSEINKK